MLPPAVLLHVLLLSHPPLLLRHSFTSDQNQHALLSSRTLTRLDIRPTLTFAASIVVVYIPRWTVAAYSTSRRVSTCSFAVAPAVVAQTLVHIYTINTRPVLITRILMIRYSAYTDLCSQYHRHLSTQMGSCRIFCCPLYWCKFFRCHIRRCCLGTRLHLTNQYVLCRH